MGFSDSEAHENSFMRVKSWVKFTSFFVMNSQFVPFSQEIQCRRFHTPGAGGPGVQLTEAHWF